MAKKKEPDLEAELIQEYERWEYLREYGGSDPAWPDGVNMNLVRNHIIYLKNQIVDKYGDDKDKYPDCYFRELPSEVAGSYMARAGEIRDKAEQSLEIYLADANFQYLLVNKDLLEKKETEKICLGYVLGYVSGLAAALKNGDLVVMRRHADRAKSYENAFADCAEKMKQILSDKEQEQTKENVQLSLFQFGIGAGQCR